MTELIWSPRAVADLEEIRTFIDTDSPAWADLTVRRIVAAVERLEQFPILVAWYRNGNPQNCAKSFPGTFESSIDAEQPPSRLLQYFEGHEISPALHCSRGLTAAAADERPMY